MVAINSRNKTCKNKNSSHCASILTDVQPKFCRLWGWILTTRPRHTVILLSSLSSCSTTSRTFSSRFDGKQRVCSLTVFVVALVSCALVLSARHHLHCKSTASAVLKGLLSVPPAMPGKPSKWLRICSKIKVIVDQLRFSAVLSVF